MLEGAARKAAKAGVRFYIAGASPQTRRMLMTHGLRQPEVTYVASVEEAQELVRAEKVEGPALAG